MLIRKEVISQVFTELLEVSVYDLLHPPKDWGISPPDELLSIFEGMPERLQKCSIVHFWVRTGCVDPLASGLGQ